MATDSLNAELLKLKLNNNNVETDLLLNATLPMCKDEKNPVFVAKELQTGLVYDARMCEYSYLNHVERPARISSIYKHLEKKGLIVRCVAVPSRMATTEEIHLKHDAKHIEVIQSVCEKTEEELEQLSMDYDSIYFHPAVTKSSFLSVGCTLEIVEQVLQGKLLNGAAVVRPPGHHALSHCSMGFCHFNNVAIAAEMCIKKYLLKRILIVDWDVHYGNGTHKMFEQDPRVLYFSMHRYDNQLFWPCLAEGNFDAIGTGAGKGYNIHVPWNKSGMGDTEYLMAFEKILVPVATEYNPEIILVSAGFDSGKGDSLGNCKVSATGYAHMTKMLMGMQSKVVIILEGGYNLKTLTTSMCACVATLLGDPIKGKLHSEPPCQSAAKSIANTISVLTDYWPLLKETNNEWMSGLTDNNLSSESSGLPSLLDSPDYMIDELEYDWT